MSQGAAAVTSSIGAAAASVSNAQPPADVSTKHLAAVYRGLLGAVRRWDTMAMFHEPVSDDVVPGYSARVTDPIDLATMERRVVAGGSYDVGLTWKLETARRVETQRVDPAVGQKSEASRSLDVTTWTASGAGCESFYSDLCRMVNNALLFNDRRTPWHKHAAALGKKLHGFFTDHGSIDIASGGTLTVVKIAVGAVLEDDQEYLCEGVRRKRGREYDDDYFERKEEKQLRRDEKAAQEDLNATLQGLEADMSLSIEELKAKYKAGAAAIAQAEEDGEDEGEESDEEDTSDSDEESDSDDSSSSSGSTSSSSSSASL